ncbi:non-canonical purine NTP diphosphatase [Cellulophaga omnivescoria]|uniref:non-canonical purine NTP diphosphatase n=1 Tax=Cellulophaga omnivescoria TaxID=1888890 RepID=UPI00098615D4|nr:non-canonical purine NTP diphosphatase [Cellulophaga omnivescoria]WBU88588.1 non-canonical purine NTP diphosphatase [Cellulophaga omnivescoria]WKB80563.1 non-canonical purine NTP diphosphatase [Cellulophaga lytica]
MKIVFATHNANKFKEVQALVPKNITLVSLTDIGCFDDIPETADTIEGNAIQKANYVTEKYNLPCFSDDTGLLVNALNGEPGIYAARYAGEQKSAEDNMAKLLQKLGDNPNREAHFKTVIALQINGEQHIFTGIVNGSITQSKQGTDGFGYDPIFTPEGYNKTFAQLPLETKNKISHRAKATIQLITFLKQYNYG